MSLFRNEIHQQVWIESNCLQCWRNPSCPIRDGAIRRDRKPVEWQRNPRKGVLMADTYRCREKARRRPPPPQRHLDVPMFDVESVAPHEESDHA